jgi:hypothetical protein
MAAVRITLAVLASVALLTLGAVVALAAPDALGRAASPKAGAGRMEYCTPPEKSRRIADLQYVQSHAAAARKAYFAKHPKAQDRAAYVKAQQAHIKALQQAIANCT